MQRVDMEVFSFPVWYPIFQKDTIEAVVLPLPDDVLKYLRGSSGELSCASSEENLSVDWSDEDDYMIRAPNWSGAFFNSCLSFYKPPNFTSFNKKLKDAINFVGGEAFVKSNWHAATDIKWANRSLKCTKIEDIYLLLKKSEVLNKDLRYEFKNNYPNGHCVVIKKWISIDRRCEFRCFIKDCSLIGISQRDCTTFYPHINHNKFHIMRKIIMFFQENIRDVFTAPNYVVDIIMHRYDFIQIIDFQQLNEDSTEGLLFKWEEIINWIPRVDELGESPDAPEFRFIGPY